MCLDSDDLCLSSAWFVKHGDDVYFFFSPWISERSGLGQMSSKWTYSVLPTVEMFPSVYQQWEEKKSSPVYFFSVIWKSFSQSKRGAAGGWFVRAFQFILPQTNLQSPTLAEQSNPSHWLGIKKKKKKTHMTVISRALEKWVETRDHCEGMTVIVSFRDWCPQVRVITEDHYSLPRLRLCVCVCVLRRPAFAGSRLQRCGFHTTSKRDT